MKGDDLEIDTAQTPERFDGCVALQEKIRKTLADSIPSKYYQCTLAEYKDITHWFVSGWLDYVDVWRIQRSEFCILHGY